MCFSVLIVADALCNCDLFIELKSLLASSTYEVGAKAAAEKSLTKIVREDGRCQRGTSQLDQITPLLRQSRRDDCILHNISSIAG